MNRRQFPILTVATALAGVVVPAGAQNTAADFTNFIRQIQQPSGFERDVTGIAANGTMFSPLSIDPGGADFQLWTVRGSTLEQYMLDTKYVGAYIPVASVVISTEDPYQAIPRTRADRPFSVNITVQGLLSDPSAPDPSKSVKLFRHVQSYGADGDGTNVDRSQATLVTQAMLTANGTHALSYSLTSVPGTNLAKKRGEERFSVFSLADYQVDESQLASKFVQIWPVADGSISGLTDGEELRFNTPVLTLTLNDLYPASSTYAHVYKGQPALGTDGRIIPGSALVLEDTVPTDRVLVIDDWDSVIDESGTWTMELLTETPFGVDRLDYLTFEINRDIEVNGTVTTIE